MKKQTVIKTIAIIIIISLICCVGLTSCKKEEPAKPIVTPQVTMVTASINFSLVDIQIGSLILSNPSVKVYDENGNLDTTITNPLFTVSSVTVYQAPCDITPISPNAFSKSVPEGKYCTIEIFNNGTLAFRCSVGEFGFSSVNGYSAGVSQWAVCGTNNKDLTINF